ncbi:MAG TPA: hypothetical protein VN958_13570, partial [Chitinophagaceae bacterium]|nr:hypothetical protein [Chitinophagaceae bacterium]
MKNTLLSFCCVLVSVIGVAQQPGSFNRQGGNQNMNIGHLYGKAVDSKTNKGISGATVQLIGTRFDAQQRRDTTLKHDSGFRRFDSTSLKFDSASHKFDTAFQKDASLHKFDTVAHKFDTTRNRFDTS